MNDAYHDLLAVSELTLVTVSALIRCEMARKTAAALRLFGADDGEVEEDEEEDGEAEEVDDVESAAEAVDEDEEVEGAVDDGEDDIT